MCASALAHLLHDLRLAVSNGSRLVHHKHNRCVASGVCWTRKDDFRGCDCNHRGYKHHNWNARRTIRITKQCGSKDWCTMLTGACGAARQTKHHCSAVTPQSVLQAKNRCDLKGEPLELAQQRRVSATPEGVTVHFVCSALSLQFLSGLCGVTLGAIILCTISTQVTEARCFIRSRDSPRMVIFSDLVTRPNNHVNRAASWKEGGGDGRRVCS